jgi:hypothetical protein
MVKMAAQHRKRSEWQRVIREFGSSGLTQQQFADARGLNAKTLENWVYRLRREARASATPVHFFPVSVRAPAPDAAARNDGGRIEVEYGAGLCVRFAVGIDCDYLGRLFSTLARSTTC